MRLWALGRRREIRRRWAVPVASSTHQTSFRPWPLTSPGCAVAAEVVERPAVVRSLHRAVVAGDRAEQRLVEAVTDLGDLRSAAATPSAHSSLHTLASPCASGMNRYIVMPSSSTMMSPRSVVANASSSPSPEPSILRLGAGRFGRCRRLGRRRCVGRRGGVGGRRAPPWRQGRRSPRRGSCRAVVSLGRVVVVSAGGCYEGEGRKQDRDRHASSGVPLPSGTSDTKNYGADTEKVRGRSHNDGRCRRKPRARHQPGVSATVSPVSRSSPSSGSSVIQIRGKSARVTPDHDSM